MKKIALCLILGSAAVLAAMGLVFCWMCPAGVGMRAGSPHWMVGRMVVGNLLGLLLGNRLTGGIPGGDVLRQSQSQQSPR